MTANLQNLEVGFAPDAAGREIHATTITQQPLVEWVRTPDVYNMAAPLDCFVMSGEDIGNALFTG
jgi:hypothetical protein